MDQDNTNNGDNPTYQLADGRQVSFKGKYRLDVYCPSGLMEGDPVYINRKILKDAINQEVPFLGMKKEPVLVVPVGHENLFESNKASRGYRNEYTWIWELPQACVMGTFHSASIGSGSPKSRSVLQVIWFEDFRSEEVPGHVLEKLSNIDWDAHSYDGCPEE